MLYQTIICKNIFILDYNNIIYLWAFHQNLFNNFDVNVMTDYLPVKYNISET